MFNRNALLKVPVTMVMLLLFITAPADIMASRHHGHDNHEYSMDVTALMGPEGAELSIFFSTSDPENYPLPEELEKLKVKIHRKMHNRGHGHGVFINERDVELIDNQVSFSMLEAPLYATLKVDVKFRVGRHKVKFKKYVDVTLRPDLIVEDVGYPMTVFVDQPFSIHANLREILGDNSAVANVNLSYDGLDMLTPDVFISSGMPTTVVFTGLHFSELGIVSFTVDITDASPGEYDLSNNSYSFDIEVFSVPTPGETEYYMLYENFNDVFSSVSTEICGILDETVQSGDRDQFLLEGSSGESTPGGNLDVSFRIYADGGSAYALDIEDMELTETVGGFEYYEYSDEATGIFINYDRNPGNIAYFTINKYSGMDIYVNRLDGDITFSSIEDYGLHMDAQTSIHASILFDDGVSRMGGTANMALGDPVFFEDDWGYSLSNSECDGDTTYWYISNEYIRGEDSGIMDPTFLARRNHADVPEPVIPAAIYLANNYPNPFNPTTAISFGLPEESRVSMRLYDITGREVLKLAEGRFSAGEHSLYLDASELSSGSYFYSLETGSFKEVKRMLLLK